MASWKHGIDWTPERANRIADIITQHGVSGRCTTQLRQAIRAKSPVIGSRAEKAYDEARELAKTTLDHDEYRAFTSAITDALSDNPPEREPIDWIQEWVIKRAHAMNLNASQIAARAGNWVSVDTVQRYITRRGAISTIKLQHVFDALGVGPTHPMWKVAGRV